MRVQMQGQGAAQGSLHQGAERLATAQAMLLPLVYSWSGALYGTLGGLVQAMHILAPLLTSGQGLHKLCYGTGPAAYRGGEPQYTSRKGASDHPSALANRVENDGYIVIKPLPPSIIGVSDQGPTIPGTTPHTTGAAAGPPQPIPRGGVQLPDTRLTEVPMPSSPTVPSPPTKTAATTRSIGTALPPQTNSPAPVKPATATQLSPIKPPSADSAHLVSPREAARKQSLIDSAYEPAPLATLSPGPPSRASPAPSPPRSAYQDTEDTSEYSRTEASATPSESTTPGVTPRASAANTPRFDNTTLPPEPASSSYQPEPAAAGAVPGAASSNASASRRAVHASQESSVSSTAVPPAGDKGKKRKGRKGKKAAEAFGAPFKALSRAISGDKR